MRQRISRGSGAPQLNERTPSDAPGVRILLDRCLAACAAAPALGFRCLRLSVSLDTLAALAAQSLRLVRERAACCGSTLLLQSLGREEPVLLCSTHRRSQLDLPSRWPEPQLQAQLRDTLLLVAERRRCPLSYVSWSVRTVCQLPWSCARRLGRSVPGGRICVLQLRPRSSLAGLPPAKDNFNIHFNTGDTAAATRA